jgi:O-antigen ligase
MHLLLPGLAFFLVTSNTFSLDLSLAPGLSAKNAILYLVLLFIVVRAVVARDGRIQLTEIHLTFGLLIGYALLSVFVAAMVVEFPRYELTEAIIRLKSVLLDQFIFFLVFFHGARSAREAVPVLKAFLAAVVLANLITVVDGLGIWHLGVIEERPDGRVRGALGESNQYAAFIAAFLPALFAAAAVARGGGRILWSGAILISAAAFLMTVSRGAMVGILAGGLAGILLFRRLIPPARIASWAGMALLVGAIVVLALSMRYGALLHERLFGQSGADLTDVSSGRTEIWTGALERMLETPLSFLTGFGYDVYWSMPFFFSPHNHYLSLWFNLGLPGLILGTLLLVMVVRSARFAAERAPDLLRPHLMAFVFGTLMLAVAAFFVDLYHPWYYFWAYAGLLMRIASECAEFSPAPVQPGARRNVKPRAPAVYGWKAAPR